MARDKDTYDFLPSVVAAMERPPAFYTRVVSLLIVTLVVLAGLWAFLSRVDIIVSAQGEIVPAGRVKVVQAADQGIVRQIFVDDGEVVDAGAALIELDSTTSKAEEAQLEIKRVRAVLTVQRLRAELGQPVEIGAGVDLPRSAIETEKRLYEANETVFTETVAQLEHKRNEARAAREVSRRQLDKLHTRIEHLERKLDKKRVHAEQGLVPGEEVEDVQFQLQTVRKELGVYKEKTREAAIRLNAADEKLESARMERTSKLYDRLAKAEHELKTTEQELIKARQRTAHQVLKAPVAGVVHQLNVHTIGAVVKRGQKLLVIVPKDAGLEMDAEILNKDVGFIEEDQPVRVKVDAFEFTRYGHIEGNLQWVGSDAMVDERKGPVYPARVALLATTMPNQSGGREAVVVPGMEATADIIIGQRRLIEYFIAPLLRYRDQSLRER